MSSVLEEEVDVFKIPLPRIPSIVDELVRGMKPEDLERYRTLTKKPKLELSEDEDLVPLGDFIPENTGHETPENEVSS